MQRKDDTAQVLKSRLEAFHRQTEPVSVGSHPIPPTKMGWDPQFIYLFIIRKRKDLKFGYCV